MENAMTINSPNTPMWFAEAAVAASGPACRYAIVGDGRMLGTGGALAGRRAH
jgi:hypothetical protein